ncbi:hypothetical protein [Novosphingobium sp.]|uniref:hypothetical protein n=1 Tax=Novosphingobium sp. TaxID=1874826 RepID=UPI0026089019|nr:hypothetical protein [Novosphingobium sp.]
MSARTVVIYGPAGCGKTSNAESLRQHFCCTSVVDDFDPHRHRITPGALHLSHQPYRHQRDVESYDFAAILPQL